MSKTATDGYVPCGRFEHSQALVGSERSCGAPMSVVLIGPLRRCGNCGRVPPEGRRWPHVAAGDWFCSLDCLYGLHPELEECG
jgi:hypothetical protein